MWTKLWTRLLNRMLVSMNKTQVYIGDYSYVIDKDDKIVILRKEVDLLNNRFYTPVRHFYPPTINSTTGTIGSSAGFYSSTYSQPADEYNSMKEMIMAYDNLKHHAKLQDILNT